MKNMQNILLVDKPKGITSFDVIRRLRRTLGVRKMGHAGTLDPNATGLLIIGVGEGTRHLQEHMGLPKTYVMDIVLGIRTDTGDITGTINEETACAIPDAAQLEETLRGMVGAISLPVPAYSALKYKGTPRYVYARKGIAIEEKKREMQIFSLKLLSVGKYDDSTSREKPLLKVEMDCASGTYARSVAEEIGRRLDTSATLSDLRRTRIGALTVEQATPLIH